MKLTSRRGQSTLTLETTVGDKHRQILSKTFLYHSMAFFPLVEIRVFFCNRAKAKFMHNSNADHYRNDCITSHTHNTTVLLAQCICNWYTSVTSHKQGTGGFPQRKIKNARSIANSSVIIRVTVKVNYDSFASCQIPSSDDWLS
jgi:hypothetical protein